MGVFDFLNAKEYKKEIEQLQSEVSNLNQLLTPEMRDVKNIQKTIDSLKDEQKRLEQNLFNLKVSLSNMEKQIESKKQELIQTDEEILLQEFGLYNPKYDFASSEIYKRRLETIREEQKNLIKHGNAASGNLSWNINGDASQGKKMVKDMQKLLVRAFNSECDEVISKVKYNNIESAEKRIKASCDSISSLGKIMHICITYPYYCSKIDELYLSYEYQQKKQEEREEAKLQRERLKEEAKIQKEIDAARKAAEKEKNHYDIALKNANNQLNNCSNDKEKEALLEKIKELESKLVSINQNIKDIDYREANQKAGYVYVISNIGAFGENVYKIGMTRRLEPMDRIYELGNASVPFNFDVHAMIFSEDAPKLESVLHRTFADKKVNMVNTRREFFNVTLDEIEKVVKENHDKTVEFVKIPDAQQYRESLKMRNIDINENLKVHVQPSGLILSDIPQSQSKITENSEVNNNQPYKVDLVRHTPHRKRIKPNKHLRN